jgi:hypothetical protein
MMKQINTVVNKDKDTYHNVEAPKIEISKCILIFIFIRCT